MANQFVVQLKNEPGAMATLAEALAAGGVDLRAIGGGSIGDLRLYTVYAPPAHAPGTIHRTREEAEADEADHYEPATVR